MKPLVIQFSGGRTSAFMTKFLFEYFPDREKHVLFENTGLEFALTKCIESIAPLSSKIRKSTRSLILSRSIKSLLSIGGASKILIYPFQLIWATAIFAIKKLLDT